LQPLYLEPVKEMPIKHFYDAAKHAIYFTGESGERNGVWGPVDKAIYDYTVGGMNVIGSWFKYRKKNPGGKKTSPLDDIHVTEWPHEWSLEFTELLTVLARLVSLEPDQKELLDEILAGELSLTRASDLVHLATRLGDMRDLSNQFLDIATDQCAGVAEPGLDDRFFACNMFSETVDRESNELSAIAAPVLHSRRELR
jgi:hypothetical protein